MAKAKVKAKTNKTASSRFKITASGKVITHGSNGRRHILTKKSSNRKMRMAKGKSLIKSMTKTHAKMIIGQ